MYGFYCKVNGVSLLSSQWNNHPMALVKNTDDPINFKLHLHSVWWTDETSLSNICFLLRTLVHSSSGQIHSVLLLRHLPNSSSVSLKKKIKALQALHHAPPLHLHEASAITPVKNKIKERCIRLSLNIINIDACTCVNCDWNVQCDCFFFCT